MSRVYSTYCNDFSLISCKMISLIPVMNSRRLASCGDRSNIHQVIDIINVILVQHQLQR